MIEIFLDGALLSLVIAFTWAIKPTTTLQPGAGGYLAPPASAPEPTPAPVADAIFSGRSR